MLNVFATTDPVIRLTEFLRLGRGNILRTAFLGSALRILCSRPEKRPPMANRLNDTILSSQVLLGYRICG